MTMLAALLLPALSSTRERARRVTCIQNLKQFALAWQMYSADYSGRYPGSKDVLYSGASPIYPNYINNNPAIFWCPSDKNSIKPTVIDGPNCENSYKFVYGLKIENSASVLLPLASDYCRWATSEYLGNHTQGANTVYLDGSVHWFIYPFVDSSSPQVDPQFFSAQPDPGPGKIACDKDGASITLRQDGTNSDTWGIR